MRVGVHKKKEKKNAGRSPVFTRNDGVFHCLRIYQNQNPPKKPRNRFFYTKLESKVDLFLLRQITILGFIAIVFQLPQVCYSVQLLSSL